MSKQSNSSER